jgi:hypothetical protein
VPRRPGYSAANTFRRGVDATGALQRVGRRHRQRIDPLHLGRRTTLHELFGEGAAATADVDPALARGESASASQSRKTSPAG